MKEIIKFNKSICIYSVWDIFQNKINYTYCMFVSYTGIYSVGKGTKENGSRDLIDVTRTLHGDGLAT